MAYGTNCVTSRKLVDITILVGELPFGLVCECSISQLRALSNSGFYTAIVDGKYFVFTYHKGNSLNFSDAISFCVWFCNSCLNRSICETPSLTSLRARISYFPGNCLELGGQQES